MTNDVGHSVYSNLVGICYCVGLAHTYVHTSYLLCICGVPTVRTYLMYLLIIRNG